MVIVLSLQIEKVYQDFAKVYNDPDAEIRNYREGWKDLCQQHQDGPTIVSHILLIKDPQIHV